MTTRSHDFVPGDILSATWGYSMTMVDFYKVLKVTPHTVTLARIGTKDEKQTGFLSGTVMPDPDNILTETDWKAPFMTRADGSTVRPTKQQVFVRRPKAGYVQGHNSSAVATKWDGTPRHFNHCD